MRPQLEMDTRRFIKSIDPGCIKHWWSMIDHSIWVIEHPKPDGHWLSTKHAARCASWMSFDTGVFQSGRKALLQACTFIWLIHMCMCIYVHICNCVHILNQKTKQMSSRGASPLKKWHLMHVCGNSRSIIDFKHFLKMYNYILPNNVCQYFLKLTKPK